jgi:hypothetical protein
VILRASALLVVLALPYVRFQIAHPRASYDQLRERGSELLDSAVPISNRISLVTSEYLYGLSPFYWFFPNSRDLSRHVMKGYGNLLHVSLPFALFGLALAVKEFRSSAHRTVLMALLASPTGGALAAIGVPRLLMFVIPAVLFTALGLTTVWESVARKLHLSYSVSAGLLFATLGGLNGFMLRDALVNGSTWFTDYGLYGMQYGAKQLFVETIPQYLQTPRTIISVSPTWANGTDEFVRFFLPPEQQDRVIIRNVDYYRHDKRDLPPTEILVMTPGEYERALVDPKFKTIQVRQILYYPDGKPGFYFTRLSYADDVDHILANERAERRTLTRDVTRIDGQAVTILHSRFGAGEVADVFDRDADTLVRGEEANPLVFDFHFPVARAIAGLTLTTGTMANYTVTVRLYGPEIEQPVLFSRDFQNQPTDPAIQMSFDAGPSTVGRLELLITDKESGETAEIHVREIKFES